MVTFYSARYSLPSFPAGGKEKGAKGKTLPGYRKENKRGTKLGFLKSDSCLHYLAWFSFKFFSPSGFCLARRS